MSKTAPDLTVDEAMAKGDEYMILAKKMFDTSDHLRLEATANDLARANFLQTRALAFYQYAANALVIADRSSS